MVAEGSPSGGPPSWGSPRRRVRRGQGLGLLLQGIGATVTDPLTFLTERFGLAATIASADLVVTGAEELDFHALGGPVVKRVAALAGEALRPVIAVVGRNFVSSRELRLGASRRPTRC
nr:glycerate kinase [Tessaracoccus coleopterorum]